METKIFPAKSEVKRCLAKAVGVSQNAESRMQVKICLIPNLFIDDKPQRNAGVQAGNEGACVQNRLTSPVFTPLTRRVSAWTPAFLFFPNSFALLFRDKIAF